MSDLCPNHRDCGGYAWLDSRGECIDPDEHRCEDCYCEDREQLKARAKSASAVESAKLALAIVDLRADNDALRNVTIQTQRDLDYALLELNSARQDIETLSAKLTGAQGLLAMREEQAAREAVPA